MSIVQGSVVCVPEYSPVQCSFVGVPHNSTVQSCRCTLVKYSAVLQVYLSTVQCSVVCVPEYSTVQCSSCTSNISSPGGDDGGAGEKRPCMEQLEQYFPSTTNVERRCKMENYLPVEENPCWGEQVPLGEGWLIRSPSDMHYSISSGSEFKYSSVHNVQQSLVICSTVQCMASGYSEAVCRSGLPPW